MGLVGGTDVATIEVVKIFTKFEGQIHTRMLH